MDESILAKMLAEQGINLTEDQLKAVRETIKVSRTVEAELEEQAVKDCFESSKKFTLQLHKAVRSFTEDHHGLTQLILPDTKIVTTALRLSDGWEIILHSNAKGTKSPFFVQPDGSLTFERVERKRKYTRRDD